MAQQGAARMSFEGMAHVDGFRSIARDALTEVFCRGLVDSFRTEMASAVADSSTTLSGLLAETQAMQKEALSRLGALEAAMQRLLARPRGAAEGSSAARARPPPDACADG